MSVMMERLLKSSTATLFTYRWWPNDEIQNCPEPTYNMMVKVPRYSHCRTIPPYKINIRLWKGLNKWGKEAILYKICDNRNGDDSKNWRQITKSITDEERVQFITYLYKTALSTINEKHLTGVSGYYVFRVS